VVDCGGLENRCAARHPGFESLSLRRTYWTKQDSKWTKTYKSAICRFFLLPISLVSKTTKGL
jgi:hypothetical protein